MTGRWAPIRITPDPAGATVEWCRSDGLAFDDPFVDQTVEAALRHPARLLFRRTTPLRDLAAVADGPVAGDDPVPVAGLVLHLSRCGSTLVTRMLGDVPGVLALSEPGVLDTLVRTPAEALGIDEAERPALVRGLLAALGRARSAADRWSVVKADAWTLLQLPLLLGALPEVPWVVVTRDPVAVLRSHRTHRGYHLVPGTVDASLLGVPEGGLQLADLDEYAAFVTGRLAAAALDALDAPASRGMVVDHAQLPGAVERVAAHLGLAVDDVVRARWRERSAVHAKNPVLPYDPAPAPQAEGADDAELRAHVARWAAGPVAALQARAGLEAVA